MRRGVRRRSSSFSSILERRGRRLIGRYDVTSVGSFPDLTIIIICPFSSAEGSIPGEELHHRFELRRENPSVVAL